MKSLSKLYKNRIVHNILGHPAREIAYLLLKPFLGRELASDIAKDVHDFTLPDDNYEGW